MVSGSSTITVEPGAYKTSKSSTHDIQSPLSLPKIQPVTISDGQSIPLEPIGDGALPDPNTAAVRLARWNHPRINMYRVLATFYSFVILGLNDSAYGAIIPYLETYYNVNYTIISLIFLSPNLGYFTAAITNNMLHVRFGQRGIAALMSLSHVFAYLVISLHPPFPVLVVVFVLAGFGNGIGDGAWNAWIGDMANANELLGFLHSFYGLGGVISPLVATTLITKAGWQWYEYYYLMVGAAVIEVVLLVGTFWKANGAVFRAEHPQKAEDINCSGMSTPLNGQPHGSNAQHDNQRWQSSVPLPWYIRINPFKNPKSRTAEAVKNKITIISAVYLLLYVGAEVSIGGWIVTFMLRVRGASPFASGLTSTGFWLGITVGRLVLGFVTARVFRNEKYAVITYLVIALGLQLLLWLVPKFLVSAVMVGLLGFFLGPLFPAAILVLTKLLPKKLHVAGIGFAAALGASGASILPFATGAIANAKGVQVLQPIVLAFLAAQLGVWLLLPKLPKQRTA